MSIFPTAHERRPLHRILFLLLKWSESMAMIGKILKHRCLNPWKLSDQRQLSLYIHSFLFSHTAANDIDACVFYIFYEYFLLSVLHLIIGHV